MVERGEKVGEGDGCGKGEKVGEAGCRGEGERRYGRVVVERERR